MFCRALSKFGDLGIPVSFFVEIYSIQKFLSDFSSRKFSRCLFDATSFIQLNASNHFGIRIFSGVILCKNSWFCKNSCLVLTVWRKNFLGATIFIERKSYRRTFSSLRDLEILNCSLWKFLIYKNVYLILIYGNFGDVPL